MRGALCESNSGGRALKASPAAEEQRRRAIAQHTDQADEFEASYSDSARDAYSSCFAYSRRRLDIVLSRYLPSNGSGRRLLDVGCGTGHHLGRFQARGFEIAGVDGSAAMLEHARRRNPAADLRQGDVEHLPFEDSQFDVAVCIEVLRYLPRPETCLREMRRVLRPGGICLATAVPLLNLNGYWIVNRMVGLVPLANLVRLRQYFVTSGEVARAFAGAGFEAVRIHGVYFGPINWVERLMRPLLPRFLRAWETLDSKVADRWPLREFSNMFLVRGVASAEGPLE